MLSWTLSVWSNIVIEMINLKLVMTYKIQILKPIDRNGELKWRLVKIISGLVKKWLF